MKTMTKAVDKAWDALSEIVETPHANGKEYEALRRAGVRLLLALNGMDARYRMVRRDVATAAASALSDEADDTEARAEAYGLQDRKDTQRDVRRFRRLARMLEGAKR